jgi:hypothetical protein
MQQEKKEKKKQNKTTELSHAQSTERERNHK